LLGIRGEQRPQAQTLLFHAACVYPQTDKEQSSVHFLPVVLFLYVVFVAHGGAAPRAPPALADVDEVRIGKALAAKFIALEGTQPTPQTTKIDNYLQSVGDKLAAHAQRQLPYRFHYDPDPGFKSAFALPGGEIFVGAGVLAMMDTEDQLAIVLGHEMEHVAQNQCRDRLLQELSKTKLTADSGDQLKVEPFLPGYGHDREFLADREGVKLAAAAGYSPQAAIRLLTMYVIMGQQMTHTASEAEQNLKDRIAQIQRLIEIEKLALPKERDLALP
jgi:predicted Zn-dependent protease